MIIFGVVSLVLTRYILGSVCNYMKKMFPILVVLSVVLLIGGFTNDSIAACVARALGAVFFILAFICKLAQKMESEA